MISWVPSGRLSSPEGFFSLARLRVSFFNKKLIKERLVRCRNVTRQWNDRVQNESQNATKETSRACVSSVRCTSKYLNNPHGKVIGNHLR